MAKNHLASFAAPRTWRIKRKEHRWVARPRPGPHKLKEAITLNYILKDLLHQVKTTKEVKFVLNNGLVLVDKKVRKDSNFPVGFMDSLEITKTGEQYRILHDNKGRLTLVPIKEKDTSLKLLKIIGKTKLKKGKLQFNLNDGKNLLLDTSEGNVGDSLLYDLKEKKVIQIIPFKKGTQVYLTAGKHIGELAIIKEFLRTKDLHKAKVALQSGKNTFLTFVSYVLPVGDHTSLLQLEAHK